jgi:predicted nucleotidyltransferase component of viral defense system
MIKNKFKTARDFRKSLETRLQAIAKEKNIDLQRVRRQVAFDRLLARLFAQAEPPFFLKGGYAMELRISSARATKDIDLTYFQRIENLEGSPDAFILHTLRTLAAVEIDDYFSYRLEAALMDLDGAPYGGYRYPVTSFIDGKQFVQFHLDVGGDVLVTATETFTAPDWLHFSGVTAPKVAMISVEQQFAEKMHAYTLPRGERQNSRVKDLIDLYLLMKLRPPALDELAFAVRQVFKVRNTHSLPLQLPSWPAEWKSTYAVMARECGIEEDIDRAFAEISSIYSVILNVNAP